MPAAARKKPTTSVVRRVASPVQTKQIARLEGRLRSIGSKGRQVAARNEQTMLTFVGAAAIPLLTRFNVNLPTIGDVEPGLLYGAITMLLAGYAGQKNGERIFATGLGMATPAIAKAIKTGSIKVAGDGDSDDDDDEI